MADVFLCGALADPALLGLVADGAETRPAMLPGYRLVAVADGAVTLPARGQGTVSGRVLTPDAATRDRLDFLARALGGAPQAATARVDGQDHPVTIWASVSADAADPADPSPAMRDALLAAVPDILALQGSADPVAVHRRLTPMLVRAASRLRAAKAAPHDLRRAPENGDVTVTRRQTPYANFFAVEEADLSFRRFDGSHSPTVNRAAFISGDAVTLLPYDPVRDRVLIIEQFRAGPFLRGDPNPWSLEAIAGRIDPGETPEEAGRREAMEEAGLTPGAMIPVASYYPTPAAKIEFLYSYIALCDLPDGAAGVFGVEGEAEDIRGHLIPFDRLMALVSSGEVGNAPLILTTLWLERERPRLRVGLSPR